MVEDIIFLGAGASKADGAPIQAELFKEYFINPEGFTNLPEERRLFESLKKFFAEFFGIDFRRADMNNVLFPTFEEVLGVLEFALKREEGFKGWYLDNDNSMLQDCKRNLIFLIASVLEKKLSGEAVYHKKLVTRLKKENRLHKTAFVSVNYETLIDNALMDESENCLIDYGVELTNYTREKDFIRPTAEKKVYLHKVHGSLNWLYCPTCVTLTLMPLRKNISKLLRTPGHCGSCNGLLAPIIIPPTFFKVMTNYFVEQIWHQVELLVRQVKRIYFCGYSFPDADVHIKYLLKRAELNGSTPEIIIVNHHDDKNEAQRLTEKNRYERFFVNKERVNYTSQSFQHFCEFGI